MISNKKVITVNSYAAGLGADGDSKPVCIILGYDTVPPVGDHLLAGKGAALTKHGLEIKTDSEVDLLFTSPALQITDGIALRLPIYVVDPKTNREVLIPTVTTQGEA